VTAMLTGVCLCVIPPFVINCTLRSNAGWSGRLRSGRSLRFRRPLTCSSKGGIHSIGDRVTLAENPGDLPRCIALSACGCCLAGNQSNATQTLILDQAGSPKQMHRRCSTVCYAEAMFGEESLPFRNGSAGRPRGLWWRGRARQGRAFPARVRPAPGRVREFRTDLRGATDVLLGR